MYARRTGAGKAYGSSVGYELRSGDTVEPDASFVLASTLARSPKPDPDAFLSVVPDLVVEILSPSTTRRDRTEKKKVYAQNGIAEYWIVDPASRSVSVFCLAGKEYAAPLEVLSGTVESRGLAGLCMDLDTIFAD